MWPSPVVELPMYIIPRSLQSLGVLSQKKGAVPSQTELADVAGGSVPGVAGAGAGIGGVSSLVKPSSLQLVKIPAFLLQQ